MLSLNAPGCRLHQECKRSKIGAFERVLQGDSLRGRKEKNQMLEYATANRSNDGKRIWKQHCADKRKQDAAAGKRLAELERQHPEPVVSLELAKARTKVAAASLRS